MIEAVGQSGRLDLGRHPVGIRSSGARQAIDHALRSVGPEVAPDLVELLARIARHLLSMSSLAAQARETFEISLVRSSKDRLATCYLVQRHHLTRFNAACPVKVGANCQATTLSGCYAVTHSSGIGGGAMHIS